MENFIYKSETKIVFGKDQIQELGTLLQEHNATNILFVYGKDSVKKLGIYEQVKEACSGLKIGLFEESGVRPNPEVTSVRNGIKTVREKKIDFILAAGGGSVLDCAKAIGFGALIEEDVWDIYKRKAVAKASLPIGAIMTLAATGSETNGNSVISNDETGEKRAAAYSFSVPRFAIIDPSYTLSVNVHHTYAGSIDIIMHVLEQYFSNTKRTDTSDYMSLGVIRSVIENTNRYKDGENTYEVRANLSWASTIGLNWILGVDKIGDWATHRLSYVLTKEYDITHGYALAMLFTSWARVALKYNKETMERRLSRLGEFLFYEKDANKVLDKLDDLFKSFNASVRISDQLTLSDETIKDLVDNALELGSVGTVITVDHEKATEIFKLACEVTL